MTLLAVSFAYMITTTKHVFRFTDDFDGLTRNWQELNLIYAIQTEPTLVGFPSDHYYTETVSGVWPGTVAGCDCTQNQGDLVANECNAKYQSKCTKIPARGSQQLTKWYNSLPVYTVRMKRTNQAQLRDKMLPDGSCAEGYQKCGDPNSLSRGLCVPDYAVGCPIVGISSTAQTGWDKILFLGFDLFTKIDNSGNPMVDLTIRESHMCANREHVAVTDNRQQYRLMDADYTKCTKNPAYTELYDMGELDILAINSVNVGGLPKFSTSNQYRWKMMAGSVTEWSPDCPVQMSTFAAKVGTIPYLVIQYKILYGVFIGSFCLMMIIYIGYFFSVCSVAKDDKTCQFYCIFVLRMLSWVISFPSMIIVTYQLVTFRDMFAKLVSAKCSNQVINSVVASNFENFDSNILSSILIMITLSVSAVIIEMFCVAIVFSFVDED